jgi:trans-2,3-dihydro-3-hydroxyanthranilate isomerase
MATYRFVQCDVFAARALEGNALAVFTDARGLDAATMQRLARETNLSETTFVLPPEGRGDFRVRVFTPELELPFAGHPLIGTAAVLGRSLPLDRLAFETGVGMLPLELEREGGHVTGAVLEQPEPSFAPLVDPGPLLAALELRARPVTLASNGLRFALVPVDSAEELARLAPEPARLRAALDVVGVSVYAAGEDPVRVRVFVPSAGVAEDPGTGSAAGPLGELLVREGHRAPGRIELLQGVEIGRPSTIEVVAGHGRPRVGGAVTLVARGSYVL